MYGAVRILPIHQASFAPYPASDKNFRRTMAPQDSSPMQLLLAPAILSDEIDVRPMFSSALGMEPRDAIIGRPPSLTTRLDDPLLGEEKFGRSCLQLVGSHYRVW
jgi:hypothetical protein